MTRRKQPPKDLTGIRQRGGTYQVRVSAGYDAVTGRQLMLSGSADTEEAAIVIRDQLRQQVRDNTAARTNVTLGYLLDEWLSGHQVEETTRDSYRLLINGFIRPALGATPVAQLCKQGPRPFEQLYGQLRVCRHRCHGRTFIEHRTPDRMHVTSGAPSTCANRLPSHPSASATRCSAEHSARPGAGAGSPSTRRTRPRKRAELAPGPRQPACDGPAGY
jgi:hypothetical protein